MDLFQILLTATLTVNLCFFVVCFVMKSSILIRLGNKTSLSEDEQNILEKSKATTLSFDLVKTALAYVAVYTLYYFGGWWMMVLLLPVTFLTKNWWSLQSDGGAKEIA